MAMVSRTQDKSPSVQQDFLPKSLRGFHWLLKKANSITPKAKTNVTSFSLHRNLTPKIDNWAQKLERGGGTSGEGGETRENVSVYSFACCKQLLQLVWVSFNEKQIKNCLYVIELACFMLGK